MMCLSGGSTLYIESSLTRPLDQSSSGKDTGSSGGHLQVTGHLGDVMKESAQIAHTVAKTFLSQLAADNDFLQKAHVHVHVPEVSLYIFWVVLEKLSPKVFVITASNIDMFSKLFDCGKLAVSER